MRRRSPAPTPSTPATASCRRTPTSPRPSIDADLIWIGPSPQAIRDLGDKVTARHIAARAQAPLVPGTSDPVKDADEVVAFAKEYGVPIAIKAAFGGGGRGMKVARTLEEIPELFESATREAVAAFGRGECFVERYLDKPRHVEAQVIADQHGNVVVAGTRDCSLQRRFQKLVEEAPAPFLTDAQRKEIHESAKRICKEAHYYGAGTVEYLVGQDGLISFLEVNTRLQVEHPVTEETAGIDLVLQQFKIANGEKLDLTEDPTPRGHAIEFRINGEDAGRGFLPAPGPVTQYSTRQRPRRAAGLRRRGRLGDRRPVRLDAGQADRVRRRPRGGDGAGRAGRSTSSRSRAWPPSSRSIARWCPIRRSSATATASRCTPGGSRRSGTTRSSRSPVASLSTRTRHCRGRRWWSRSAAVGSRCRYPATSHWATAQRRRTPVSFAKSPSRASAVRTRAPEPPRATRSPRRCRAPWSRSRSKRARRSAAGDLVVVLEAMKMENPVTAHKDGTITGLAVEAGAAITQGTVLAEIK